MVTPEARRVCKFEKGLRLEIRHAMASVLEDDFPMVVRCAHAIERIFKKPKWSS